MPSSELPPWVKKLAPGIFRDPTDKYKYSSDTGFMFSRPYQNPLPNLYSGPGETNSYFSNLKNPTFEVRKATPMEMYIEISKLLENSREAANMADRVRYDPKVRAFIESLPPEMQQAIKTRVEQYPDRVLNDSRPDSRKVPPGILDF